MNMSVQVRAIRVNRQGHAGARDLGGMRKLLTSCNHIYLGIMLTTAFLFFTVLDGKNQLLLALLKCTGKGFSFFTKQHTQEVPKTLFFYKKTYPRSRDRVFLSSFFSLYNPPSQMEVNPPSLYSFLLW